MFTSERVILATDELESAHLTPFIRAVGHRLYGVKLHNHYDLFGPKVVSEARQAGARRIWVDHKLLDIKNTAALRAGAYDRNHIDMITVHASGEIDMMMAAVAAFNGGEVFAVTVLTSMDEIMSELTYGRSPKAAALYFARLAKMAGAAGVVCSPQEVGLLASRPELRGLKFITPGIRSAGKSADDQKRVGTPTAAIKAGATHLVIGRQLTHAADPEAALDELEAEIAEAVAATTAATPTTN